MALDYLYVNTVQGNPRYGERYSIRVHDNGEYHIYKDGTTEFVAGTPYVNDVLFANAPPAITGIWPPSPPMTPTGAIAAPVPPPAPAAPPPPPAPAPTPGAPTPPAPSPTSPQSPQFPRTINGGQPGTGGNQGPVIHPNPIIAGGLIPRDPLAPGAPNMPRSGTNPPGRTINGGQPGSGNPGSAEGVNSPISTPVASSPSPSGGGSAPSAPASSVDSVSSSSASTAAPSSDGGSHTVVHGDTMWGIAQANHMPLSQLESLNPQIADPSRIFPGQRISLGGGVSDASTPVAAPSSDGGSHTVVHGDTMWGIAQANHMPLSQLESLNPQIADPSRIFPGQQVNLGTGGATASTSSSSGATATESSVVFPKTSSYQSASSGSQVTEAASTRLSGWAGGTGAMPADPARGVIEAVSKPDTDPLKIKDNKPRTV